MHGGAATLAPSSCETKQRYKCNRVQCTSLQHTSCNLRCCRAVQAACSGTVSECRDSAVLHWCSTSSHSQHSSSGPQRCNHCSSPLCELSYCQSISSYTHKCTNNTCPLLSVLTIKKLAARRCCVTQYSNIQQYHLHTHSNPLQSCPLNCCTR